MKAKMMNWNRWWPNRARCWFVTIWTLLLTLLVLSSCSGPGGGQDGDFEGTYVAVGMSGKIWVTEDGGNWIEASVGGENLLAITYGNGRFVAAGDSGRIWWSYDGYPGTWQDGGSLGMTLNGIAYGNGRFVAVGDVGVAWWSPDGTAGSWSNGSPGDAPFTASPLERAVSLPSEIPERLCGHPMELLGPGPIPVPEA